MIGTEIIRTEIIYTRPRLERVEYIATTYGCPQCKDTEEPQFIKDNGKPAFIEGSYVSESLLSLIAYQKYGLYLPLYRQEKDFKQLNSPITRSTMAKCLITAAQEYLQPMYDFFHHKLLYRRFLMMDETPVQVLKEDDRRTQTKSYFWVIRTGEDGLNPIILYNYTPTRAGENAGRFLNGIAPGFYLMADGYQGYNKVQETNVAAVLHISAGIFWNPYQREWIRIIPILQSRVFSIVKSCSHMNIPIGKKVLAISKYTHAASKTKNRLLRVFWRG